MSRIAIVTRAHAPYLKDLQQALAHELDSGELHLLSPADEPSDFDAKQVTPDAPNAHVHEIHSCPTLGSRFPSSELWQRLDQIHPKLIWIHELSPFSLGGLLYAKKRSLPVVESTEVGQRNAHFFSLVVRIWHGLWGHLVDGVIANAPAARQPLSGESRPVVDAFHAVDSRRFFTAEKSHLESSPVTFVVVGKLIPRKGTDLLLAAASELRRITSSPFRLRFIGGDPNGWGRDQVNQLGLNEITEFAGFLEGDALREAIASADAFVLPTRQDTYAAVVHEAACLGLPLLVSRHAGACEALVEEGVTGFAINPEDREQFAQRMKTICEKVDLRIAMRKASRAAAENLSAHTRAAAVHRWLKSEFNL